MTDLLVSPVQHVMRVPLLLKEIENNSQDPAEKVSLQAIIKEQEHSLRELDDKMLWLKVCLSINITYLFIVLTQFVFFINSIN